MGAPEDGSGMRQGFDEVDVGGEGLGPLRRRAKGSLGPKGASVEQFKQGLEGKGSRVCSHTSRREQAAEGQKSQDRQRWGDTTHQSFWAKYSELRSKTDRPALASCSKSRSCMGDLLGRRPHGFVEP